jgi:hypothetical protein
LLRQAFAHCAKFPTAASRRSLGRVSVPVWLIVLSDQLPVVALVGHYPTNKLIGREALPNRNSFITKRCPKMMVSGISSSFPELSQSPGQVPHVLLTRSPLELPQCYHRMVPARLACVKHAASVRPEPGSNSPSKPNPQAETQRHNQTQESQLPHTKACRNLTSPPFTTPKRAERRGTRNRHRSTTPEPKGPSAASPH